MRTYHGLYCTGCEDFYLERDLADGRCPIHGTQPQPVSERNYFFRLSAYQDVLERLIATEASGSTLRRPSGRPQWQLPGRHTRRRTPIHRARRSLQEIE